MGVVLFRSNMCVWHITELQVMTLFVTLKVNTSVENSYPDELVPKLVES